MDKSLEQWRPIAGYEGLYEVSDQGRVRSLDRICYSAKGEPWRKGRIMKAYADPRQGKLPYSRIMLSDGTRREKVIVHVLVLEAFVGPRPSGQDARHLDGNPRNNRLSNLAWGTKQQNQADRTDHGTSNHGERHPMSILTEDQVREIRAKYKRTSYHISNRKELAQEYGINDLYLLHIVAGRSWQLTA